MIKIITFMLLFYNNIMSSSDLTSQNIIYTGDLQRVGATLGTVLASNSSGVFQLVSPPSDGRCLSSNSGQPAGVDWSSSSSVWEIFDVSKLRVLDQDNVTNFILGDSTNSISNDCVNTSVISSDTASITNVGGTTAPSSCSIISSRLSTIQDIEATVSTPMENTSIVACLSCSITGDRSDNVLIAGSSDCNVLTTMAAGNTGPRVVLGCENCDLNYNGCSFFTSSGLTIGSAAGELDEYTSYLGCDTLTHARSGNFNTFASTRTTTTGNHTRCFVKATNADIQHTGVVVLTDDNNGGTTLATLANDSFVTRFVGGVRFYTNSALTTYADLAASSGSWVAVSDRNVKENIVEVNYDDILERVRDLPVYNYNFKGNPKEVKCIGAIAQDWHSIVTPLETYTVLEDDPNNEGKKIEVEKDAKNKLGIETMDSIGVCLASIKSLDKKVELLFEESSIHDKKIQELEEEIKSLM